MSLSSYSKEGILTIQFLDPRILDETQQARVAQDVVDMLNKTSEEKVILDFKPVQFMASAMLGKLVMIHKKCKEFKIKLKLSGIDPEIRNVFKMTKLDKLFDIEKDEEAARKAFSKRGLFG